MKSRYYVVKEKALPEVLLKVVEAKKLLATRSDLSILDAAEQVGISRSSFYKYKDDIFPFYDNSMGKTVTFMIELDDSPGHLSEVLERIAEYRANILTIHQSIPVNNVAVLTLSVEIREDTKDISEMVGEIEAFNFVYDMKIVSRE